MSDASSTAETCAQARDCPSPGHDWKSAIERLRGAYSDRTVDGYASDFSLFEKWCANEALAAIPASADTLARYLIENIERLSAVTLERRLAAIIRIHRLFDLANPADSENVRLALRRIKRFRPCRPRQAKGIDRRLRAQMLEACGADLVGLRDRALVALGFEGLCRRSEITALEVRDFFWTDDGAPAVLVRRGKADQNGEDGSLSFPRRRVESLRNGSRREGLRRDHFFVRSITASLCAGILRAIRSPGF